VLGVALQVGVGVGRKGEEMRPRKGISHFVVHLTKFAVDLEFKFLLSNIFCSHQTSENRDAQRNRVIIILFNP